MCVCVCVCVRVCTSGVGDSSTPSSQTHASNDTINLRNSRGIGETFTIEINLSLKLLQTFS